MLLSCSVDIAFIRLWVVHGTCDCVATGAYKMLEPLYAPSCNDASIIWGWETIP